METLSTHIEAVYEKAKTYTETSIELYKLNAIDTASDVTSSLALRFVTLLVVSMFTLFVNIAISLFIGKQIGEYYLGFLIVSGFYLMLTLIIYLFGVKLVKTPINNLIITKLLKDKKSHSVTLDNNQEANENVQK
ncbi:hypothetical protein APS56_08335 [Pseudalgibacter alginicilyticus]|uniref:Competence protein n=1 Tax=Pseudalgibacter alginicilyticus TaxID=1736674 RepID=A0A0P0D8N0_9FLAO|nr:phage holin family protein [Pseudalgibacter alginicilyticus]ALJ05132.1 hypothetical protein APS56_08335 [Pseudalgibacter alginicilyticus]